MRKTNVFMPMLDQSNVVYCMAPAGGRGCGWIRWARGRGECRAPWAPRLPAGLASAWPQGGPAASTATRSACCPPAHRFYRVHKQSLSKKITAVNSAGESVPCKIAPVKCRQCLALTPFYNRFSWPKLLQAIRSYVMFSWHVWLISGVLKDKVSEESQQV